MCLSYIDQMHYITESPVDEGRRYQEMINQGLTVEDIAQRLFDTAVSHVKLRLELVRIVDAQTGDGQLRIPR